jgi:outer membrane immunogenic protein
MLRAGAIALAVVAGFALSAPAFAADLPVKAPPRAAPAVSSWTGLYVGGSVGARWTDTTWTTTCIGGFANCPLNGLSATRLATNNPVDFDSTSFRGGIFVGFNWQVAQHWILGIEGDWAWADNNKTARGIPGTVLPVDFPNTLDRSEVKHSWDASVRARAGILLNPNVLLFGTAGISWLHVKMTAVCVPGPDSWGCVTDSNTTTRVGWTAGGGLEWMVAANWLIRGEYRYADYGTSNETILTNADPGDPVRFDFRARTHTALFGIAYKFGPSAVVARY